MDTKKQKDAIKLQGYCCHSLITGADQKWFFCTLILAQVHFLDNVKAQNQIQKPLQIISCYA